MNPEAHSDSALFAHALPMGVQRWLGRVTPSQLHTGRRTLLVVPVGWVPIVLLMLAPVAFRGGDGINSLLTLFHRHILPNEQRRRRKLINKM